MKGNRLFRLILLTLALLLVAKPALRIVFYPVIEAPSHRGDVDALARSRAKYDVRATDGIAKTQQRAAPLPLTTISNVGYLRHQPALAAVITARHVLNIHFRILPERKIFLQQGRLTV